MMINKKQRSWRWQHKRNGTQDDRKHSEEDDIIFFCFFLLLFSYSFHFHSWFWFWWWYRFDRSLSSIARPSDEKFSNFRSTFSLSASSKTSSAAAAADLRWASTTSMAWALTLWLLLLSLIPLVEEADCFPLLFLTLFDGLSCCCWFPKINSVRNFTSSFCSCWDCWLWRW